MLSSLQHDSHVEGLEEKTFEDLFKMFGEMKAKADQLPMGERKEFAERAVMAYWNAVGGDVTELEGLDSEEDD